MKYIQQKQLPPSYGCPNEDGASAFTLMLALSNTRRNDLIIASSLSPFRALYLKQETHLEFGKL